MTEEKTEREERERVNREIEAEHDRLAKEEADKAENARREALKPDKEKLISWIEWFSDKNIPELSLEAEEAKTIYYDALHSFRSCLEHILQRTENL